MRNAVLVLLALVAGATWLFGICGGGFSIAPESALNPGARPAPAGDPPANAAEHALPAPAGFSPHRPPVTAAEDGVLRVVEGTVLDRFGFPVAGERVLLLPGDQDHPPAGATFPASSQALTSDEGRFVLTAQTAGPWRLGVGPPGQPRIPPSVPRTFSGTIRAEIVVPGTAAARVSLEGLPETELPLVFELLALRGSDPPAQDLPSEPQAPDPGAVDDDPARKRKAQGERRSEEKRMIAARAAEKAAGKDLKAGDEARARSPQKKRATGAANDTGEQEREAPPAPNPAQKKRNQAKKPPENQGAAPPRTESWRSLSRHSLTSEERREGAVRFNNLPVGATLRLNLRMGASHVEGVRRFSPMKGSLTEVRILSITAGSPPTLAYVTSLEVLSPDDSPPGVRWLD